jgi:hypothetical protein
MAIAGRASRKMLEHYSHIRVEAKRRAVTALVMPESTPALEQNQAYVTKYVTNRVSKDNADSQTS